VIESTARWWGKTTCWRRLVMLLLGKPAFARKTLLWSMVHRRMLFEAETRRRNCYRLLHCTVRVILRHCSKRSMIAVVIHVGTGRNVVLCWLLVNVTLEWLMESRLHIIAVTKRCRGLLLPYMMPHMVLLVSHVLLPHILWLYLMGNLLLVNVLMRGGSDMIMMASE